MKRVKKLPVPRGNEVKEAIAAMDQTRQYQFTPESVNITAGEIAVILYLLGLTMPETALVQLPVTVRRHFKLKE